MTDNHENITLKEKIKRKLKESGYSQNMKAELEQLNNSTNSQQVRKMISAVLEDNEDMFINNLENPGTLSSEEEHNVERLIGLYETFVVSCIRENDSVQLTTLLYYCSVSRDGREPGPVLAGIFAKICCIGYKDCLDVVLRKIFLNKVAEDFMKTAVAEKLFDVNFYRRIVEHDRVPLLQALYSKSDAWKKDVMTKLADERKYRNVAAYLKDPEGYKMISDPRKRLPYDKRIELAEKLQAAVKMGDILNLEKCLQDLEGCKEVYSNLDNLLNETVSREPGIWKGERLMHLACRQGDLDICKALYRKGASLRVLDVNFHSPAHVAVEADQLHVLQWLNECDNKLILDFFDYGWKDPFLKDDKYLFRLKTGNVNLSILAYLLTLGCDNLLDEENIDHVLNQAIGTDDIDCIETLLGKSEAIRKQIKPAHIQEAAEQRNQKQDNQILSKLLVVASRDCINEVINEDMKYLENHKWKCPWTPQDKKTFKDWKRTCPKALPEIFEKFKIKGDGGSIEDVSENGKRIFKEMSKLKGGKILSDPRVFSYIDHNFKYIFPYYIDLFVIFVHLLCITCYCVTYGANITKNGHKEQQYGKDKYVIRWIFLVVTVVLSVKQIIEARIQRSKFVNKQDMVECILYVLSFLVIFAPMLQFPEQWELVLIILCLFISWFDLFMKLKVIPLKIGLYIEMFYSILKIFLKVILIFIMFLFCFSTAFYTLFHKAKPFFYRNSTLPFVVGIVGKTLAMVTGEFDFDELFFPSESQNTTSSDTDSAATYPSTIAYFVFFVFCICLHILLLNLLVSLAVEDISKLMDNSKGRRLRKQAELIADLEAFWVFYSWITCRKCRNAEISPENGSGTTDSKKGENGLPASQITRKNAPKKTLLNFERKPGTVDVENGHNSGEIIQLHSHDSSDDYENERRATTDTETEPFMPSQTPQPPGSTTTTSTCKPNFINWLLVKLGFKTSEKARDEPHTSEIQKIVEKLEEIEKKRLVEQKETTKTLDLMKEVIFQMDKHNRDLMNVINETDKRFTTEMDTRHKELKEEMDKRTNQILSRLPPLASAQ